MPARSPAKYPAHGLNAWESRVEQAALALGNARVNHAGMPLSFSYNDHGHINPLRVRLAGTVNGMGHDDVTH